MVEQNLQSWFLDTSLPSPHVANLLNKTTFLFQPALVCQILTIEQQTAKSEFCNSKNGKKCNLQKSQTYNKIQNAQL